MLIADFIEEAFQYQDILGRQHAQRGTGLRQVARKLIGGGRRQALFALQPGARGLRALFQPFSHLRTQSRHRRRQLVGAPRRLAEPERNVRRLAFGVLHVHLALRDPEDAV